MPRRMLSTAAVDALLHVVTKNKRISTAPSADGFFGVLLSSLQWVTAVLDVHQSCNGSNKMQEEVMLI